jgi:hypothetical protein
LKATGFQVGIHDGPPAWGNIVVEANAAGDELATGWWHHEEIGGGQDFYGKKLSESPVEPHFTWLPEVQALLEESRDRTLCTARGDTE